MNIGITRYLLHVALSSLCLSQQLPYLSSVTVRTDVSKDSNAYFYYRYGLANSNTSRGRIIGFEIDISRPENSTILDTTGLRFHDNSVESSFRRHFPSLSRRIVPVGFPQAPGIWDGALTNALTADFSGDSRMLINPGDSLGGFILMSRGLPAIRLCIVSPDFDLISLYPDVEQVSNPDSLTAAVNYDREAVKFHGFTVGPTAPPANFVHVAFLDTLLSYTRQSAQLGWLGRNRDDDCDDDERPDDGVVRNIENRLQKARRELVRGDSVKARRELVKLVRKVDRLQRRGERVMTSEAYALLKYNSEYLIERLPERRRR